MQGVHVVFSLLWNQFTSVSAEIYNVLLKVKNTSLEMVLKRAIILLALSAIVIAEGPPPQFQQHQQSSPNFYNRPPIRVKQSGASRLFEWLGSRFSKIPYFIPRGPPQFPKYPTQQGPLQQGSFQLGPPQHQTVILPEPQSVDYKEGSDSPPTDELNVIEDTPSYSSGVVHHHHEVQQEQYQPQQQQESNAPEYNQNYEVVPSQLLSYEKETMPAMQEGGWQPGFGGIPLAQPPLQNNPVPVVPQSMGPDYFNTAYANGNENKDQVQQAQPQVQPQAQQSFQQPQAQIYDQSNNFGASFLDIQQQAPQLAPGSGQFGLQTAQALQHGYTSDLSQVLNQADFSGLLSQGGLIGSDGFNLLSSNNIPVKANPPKKAGGSNTGSSSKSKDGFVPSGIPGVKILSQSEDGGNPVFEILADADAPSFGSHPFDLNKLIAMIEPGAQLIDAPVLSASASETKSTVQAPPPTGTSDLFYSESNPQPSITGLDGSKPKKPFQTFFSTSKNDSDKNKSSSLKEIMDFFQQTGGKGYVVVEKKRAPQNLTEPLTTTDDSDASDGFSRLNITSETLPLLSLDKDSDNSLKYHIIPHVTPPKLIFPVPSPSVPFRKPNRFKPLGPRKTFRPKLPRPTLRPLPLSTSVKISNLTSPVVFFAVRATTQHPNHNYNNSHPYPVLVGSRGLPAIVPTVNTLLDSVQTRPILDAEILRSTTHAPDNIDEDLSAAESSQVKSIAITVTPPPHLTSSTSTTTTTPSPPLARSIPVTKKSISSTSSSSKKRPSPVYRQKNIGRNQTLT